jgi:hypothetical protein
VRVVRIAGQAAAGLVDLADPAQDRDAVPALLTVPDCVIAKVPDRLLRELLVCAFSSCRQTMSGPDSSSQRNSTGSRPFTPFTL